MSSFAFIPRSIGKQRQNKNSGSRGHIPHGASESDPGPSTAQTGKAIAPAVDQLAINGAPNDDEGLATLELSLSDYALWCDPGLQYKMKVGQGGYIPMKWLLENSTVISSNDTTMSEIDLMRCLRSSTASTLEARMLIAEPSRSEWFARGHGSSNTANSHSGGFEVRRKDWEDVLRNLERKAWTKEWWEQRTAYIERLPAAFRSILSVSHYVGSLVNHEDKGVSPASSKNLVQSVTFPSHHSAPPKEASRCKGFAFVILDSPGLVDQLSRDYPWQGMSTKSDLDPDALKFGLRVLPKASWDVLKAEYISYQQRLLAHAAGEASELEPPTANIRVSSRPLEAPSLPEMEKDSSWYPQNCLVFVRNIHPDTNKTTLRALFKNALSSSGGDVDYVDFNKGIDSCHLRLASPSDTALLTSHFESQAIAQSDALDQVGSGPIEGRRRITLEVVQGKREEFYWEKVPEKVRNAAMERVAGRKVGESIEEDQQGGRRKRRKKF